MSEIIEGTIIQITNDKHHWFPALVVVSEPKSFGVQGYVWVVNNTEEPSKPAYIRLAHDDYEIVGDAKVIAP